MYSWEDRTRAVELWLKYDKSPTAVIKELGYPSIKMLQNWGKEYLQEQETGVSSHHQRKGKYTAEEKKVAVEHYFTHGRCLSRTMRALGYPCREILSRWCEEIAPARRKQNRSRVQFSREQKQEAVIALCSRTGSAKDIAKEHGVSREALYNSDILNTVPLGQLFFVPLGSVASHPSDSAHQPTLKGFELPQSKLLSRYHPRGISKGLITWMSLLQRSLKAAPDTMSQSPNSMARIKATSPMPCSRFL